MVVVIKAATLGVRLVMAVKPAIVEDSQVILSKEVGSGFCLMTFLTSVLQVIRKQVSSKVATRKEGTSSQATKEATSAALPINAPSLSRELASCFSA